MDKANTVGLPCMFAQINKHHKHHNQAEHSEKKHDNKKPKVYQFYGVPLYFV